MAPVQTVPSASVAADVARGVGRLLSDMGFAYLTELPLNNGRRVDLMAIAENGHITVVEVKSSLADFRSDQKWHEYLDYCDHFYFAVPTGFPTDVLPEDTGMIMADRYGAEILRPAREAKVNGTRRRFLILKFARAAANRHNRALDSVIDKDPVG